MRLWCRSLILELIKYDFPNESKTMTTATPTASYPVTFQVNHPEEIARWRPLVQWFLALPHLIVAHVLSSVSQVLILLSWVIIMVTGKMPKGIADFQVMAIRYEARVMSYVGFLRESYPAFDFTTTEADPGGDPAVIEIPVQLEDRNRLSVGLRIFFIIPLMIVSILWAVVQVVLTLIGGLAVLFTGRWPEGIRSTTIAADQWFLRVNVYCHLLRDDYPPFGL